MTDLAEIYGDDYDSERDKYDSSDLESMEKCLEYKKKLYAIKKNKCVLNEIIHLEREIKYKKENSNKSKLKTKTKAKKNNINMKINEIDSDTDSDTSSYYPDSDYEIDDNDFNDKVLKEVFKNAVFYLAPDDSDTNSDKSGYSEKSEINDFPIIRKRRSNRKQKMGNKKAMTNDRKTNKKNNKSNKKQNKNTKTTKTQELSSKSTPTPTPESIKTKIEKLLLETNELTNEDGDVNMDLEYIKPELQKILDEKNKEIETQKKKDDKKRMRINIRDYKKLCETQNTMDDYKYFKNLPIEEQSEIIEKIRNINKIDTTETPYRIRILRSSMPDEIKVIVLSKLKDLEEMSPFDGERNKLKKWINGFMKIPFGTYSKLTMTLENGVDACTNFLLEAKSILDETAYGLNDAKMQIMQLMAQMVTNPDSVGSSIAISGPPGTGKTTLVKNGISRILQRPFAFIALGGATDSSFLEGHGYTYEGSTWGKIVDILITAKTMSPLIYFDELDKISETKKGEEITGILTHLTDTTQNMKFQDRYFSQVNLDLSKALYIFSYNEEHKVNYILKDRMYCIHTNGYNVNDKLIIAKKYLIPSIMKNVGFNEDDIIFTDEVISYIISKYTTKEKGVRNLKRCLEIMITKLNLHRIMTPGTVMFDGKKILKIELPYTVGKDLCDDFIQKKEKDVSLMMLYS